MTLTLLQIVSTDDYMPMPISNLDEYDKVVNVSWFTPDKRKEDLTCVLLALLQEHKLISLGFHAFYRFLRCILSVALTLEIS